ncbi:MAG: hypothetical protein AAGE01_03975 [Pseudomonadota bacterium]
MKGTFLVTAGLLLLSLGALAQDSFSTLEERMSGRDFERAGLDKLSPAELEFLNDWLRGKGLAPARAAATGAPAAAGAPAVTEEQMGLRRKTTQSERVVIESNIVGTFRGWTGRNKWTLANGHVWEQVGGETYTAQVTENPDVRIEPKMLGSWKMYVDGYGRSVKVRRIK